MINLIKERLIDNHLNYDDDDDDDNGKICICE